MPWAAAANAMLDMMDKESDKESCIPLVQPGKLYYPEPKAYGWECTGCHATNGAHESQCSWCRTHRLAAPHQSTNSPLLFDMYASSVRQNYEWMEGITHSTEDPLK